MKVTFIVIAAALMLGCAGCMWPGVTAIHGTATVKQPESAEAPAGPKRMIVVKYWRVTRLISNETDFVFFGAEVVEQAQFPVRFPIRFYPAFFTPALGVQHLLPDAGILVFAEGRWPSYLIADDGRRCCEAPTTGKRHWHVVLQPMDQAPARQRGRRRNAEFPPLTPDKLDRVLGRNRSITQADRDMCRRQLESLLARRRENVQ